MRRLAEQRRKERKAGGHVKLAAYQEDVRAYRGRLAAIRGECGAFCHEHLGVGMTC